MDKRTLIAIALIFVVFWLSNELIWKQRTPQPVEAVREERVVVDYDRDTIEDAPEPATERIVSETEAGLFDATDTGIKNNIILSNDKITLYFSNLGAVVTSIYLNDYYLIDKVNHVNLIPDEGSLLNVIIDAESEAIDLSEQIFEWETLNTGGYPALQFYLTADGKRIVEKRFILVSDYDVQFDFGFSGLGTTTGYSLAFNSGIADTEESLKHKDNDYQLFSQIERTQRSLSLRQLRRMNGGERISGNVDWTAIRSKYFIKALIPEERLRTSYLYAQVRNESPACEIYVTPGKATVVEDSYRLYFGPLIYGNLDKYGIGLEETMELGWKIIRPLGRLFSWIISSINSVIPNYGVTIIIFALILKIFLYPLTHKSFKSMQKMQKMQPFMQEIQRKYKSDPKKMQQELGKLYKEHGTNPMGGCLPLLLQMPVFFALYPVLRYSVDLRQASFMLWITDLSEPDPLMILPIIMGLFMFVQQRMSTAKAGDIEKMDEKQKAAMQSQKMMMYIMPVFMVFIFRGLPSGLVLYWTVFNVFSIIQQYLIKKQFS